MSKHDLSLLKELFEAHLEPIKKDISDIKRHQEKPIRDDEAHARIDKWENRGWGFVTAAAFVVSALTFIGVSGLKKVSQFLA